MITQNVTLSNAHEGKLQKVEPNFNPKPCIVKTAKQHI